MKKIILKMIEKLGYSVSKINKKGPHADIQETEFWAIYNLCKPYTMTSVERMYSLYCSVNYALSNNSKGAFVECGVWRGGSSMLIAKMLSNRNILDRKIYLYDTFEGMTEPSSHDVDLIGRNASILFKEKEQSVWCFADLEDVQNNMRLVNLPSENIIYVKGKVEDTIPANLPKEDIVLLRLDTDWYESTKHELIHLFPKLINNGVVIIDDYGHWEGCKKAVDEYLKEYKINLLLNRVDYTGRAGIKVSSN